MTAGRGAKLSRRVCAVCRGGGPTVEVCDVHYTSVHRLHSTRVTRSPLSPSGRVARCTLRAVAITAVHVDFGDGSDTHSSPRDCHPTFLRREAAGGALTCREAVSFQSNQGSPEGREELAQRAQVTLRIDLDHIVVSRAAHVEWGSQIGRLAM